MKSKLKATFTKKTNILMINTGRFKFFFKIPPGKKLRHNGDLKYRGKWWWFLFKKGFKKSNVLSMFPVPDGSGSIIEEFKIPLEII